LIGRRKGLARQSADPRPHFAIAAGATTMPLDLKLYIELCNAFTEIDFFNVDSGLLPKISAKSQISTLLENGGVFVPRVYRQDYATPLQNNLSVFIARLQSESMSTIIANLEPFGAPLYQHDPKTTKTNVRPQLRRFLAVVSNLYRSFVSEKKRKSIDVPIVTETPPLAFFQSNGDLGPYTITSETMQREIGTPISVVSLPHSYADHPIVWCSLTHEVCGHDVVHADEKLVPELVTGIRTLFSPQGFDPNAEATGDALNALIWSYWIDEAVADVYGILNMGPTFALNLGAFFYAFLNSAFIRQRIKPQPVPSLRMQSLPDPDNEDRMDSHPTDILRLHLAIGVIENLAGLSATVRQAYISDIEAVAKAAANGATVQLQGAVEISHANWRNIDVQVPLAEAQEGARRVGAFIATAVLPALRNHTIQDIETWDDADEKAATTIADLILQNKSIVGMGDDAQLLAGATIAVLAKTGLYKPATALLNKALDDSYKTDPVWEGLSFDAMIDFSFLAALTKKPGKAPRKRLSGQARRKKKKKA
jgi:hypothetical protein